MLPQEPWGTKQSPGYHPPSGSPLPQILTLELYIKGRALYTLFDTLGFCLFNWFGLCYNMEIFIIIIFKLLHLIHHMTGVP